MLIIIPIAGALLFHNALASTIGDRISPQVALSGYDGPTAIPDTMEDVDISEGWADPRINGGRFLDVCLMLIAYCKIHVMITRGAPQFTAPLLGEPLNVILSGLSDPLVLTEGGFREYTK